MSAITILGWKEMPSGKLLGFARIQLASGMILNDVAVLAGERGPWASAPSKSMVGRDGMAMRDGNGKARYSAVVEFTSKNVHQRFSAAVIGALKAAHPGALA